MLDDLEAAAFGRKQMQLELYAAQLGQFIALLKALKSGEVVLGQLTVRDDGYDVAPA